MNLLGSSIEEALARQDWAQAQALMAAAADLDLAPEDEAWLALYQAELAWWQGDSALASSHLRLLTSQPGLPGDLQARLAERLSSWCGFRRDLPGRGIATKAAAELELLRWWTTYQGLPGLQAQALRYLGDAARRQARYDDAKRYYEEALGLFQEVEERAGQARVLWSLGEVAGLQARYGDAGRCFEQALGLFLEIDDRSGQAQALLGLGAVARKEHRDADAVTYYEEALELSRETGDRSAQAHALRGLGAVASTQDRYADSRGYYQEALALSRMGQDRWGQAVALRSLGHVALMRDHFQDARAHYEEALKLSRELEDRRGEAYVLAGLGEVACLQASHDDARRWLDQAFDLMCEIDMHLDGLSLAIGLANQVLDRALEQPRQDSSQHLNRQAESMARWLVGWAGRFMGEAPNPEAARGYGKDVAALTARVESPP